MRHFSLVSLSLTLLLFVAVGCSQPKTTDTISGEVQFDREVLSEGTIDFFPADGKGASVGGKIMDGKYAVELTPGKKRVEIRAPMQTGEASNGPGIPIMQERIPGRYNINSELKLDVTGPQKSVNWDLSADEKGTEK